MTRVLIALAAFILIIVAVAQWKASQSEEPVVEHEQLYNEFLLELTWRAQEYAGWFLDGELEALHEEFTVEMKLLTPLEDLVALKERISSELGDETRVVNENLMPEGDNFVYSRISEFSNFESNVQMLVTLNDDQRILGFTIQPISQNEVPPEEEDS